MSVEVRILQLVVTPARPDVDEQSSLVAIVKEIATGDTHVITHSYDPADNLVDVFVDITDETDYAFV